VHESIAKAVRRGENRRIAVRADGYWDRVLAAHTQERRGPWYRHAVEFLRNDPAAVPLWEIEIGRGKHRVFKQLAIAQDERRRWSLVFREVDARAFVVRTKGLPVEISDHVVDRLLQRLGCGGVRDALGRLRTTIPVILVLMTTRSAPFLAPVVGGGAVVAVPSDLEPGEWCLATYLGERQLRIDQRLELEVNNDEAVRVDKAMALSTPVTDALAAAVRDALHDELSRRPVPTILAARDGYVPSPIPRRGGVVPLLRAAPPR
jgi:hypothetical protein